MEVEVGDDRAGPSRGDDVDGNDGHGDGYGDDGGHRLPGLGVVVEEEVECCPVKEGELEARWSSH